MKKDFDIYVELRAHVARKYRTQKNAATAWKVSPAFVSAVLCGNKPPNDVMLADAGFVRIQGPVKYVKA